MNITNTFFLTLQKPYCTKRYPALRKKLLTFAIRRCIITI